MQDFSLINLCCESPKSTKTIRIYKVHLPKKSFCFSTQFLKVLILLLLLLFIYFLAVSVVSRASSVVAASGGYSLVVVCRLVIQVASLFADLRL